MVLESWHSVAVEDSFIGMVVLTGMVVVWFGRHFRLCNHQHLVLFRPCVVGNAKGYGHNARKIECWNSLEQIELGKSNK